MDVVWRWRKALGVGLMDSEGSRRLILDACQQGAQCGGKKLPPEERERRRRTAIALGLSRNLKLGYHGRRWTEAELALFATKTDEAIARKTCRSVAAVRRRRLRLKG